MSVRSCLIDSQLLRQTNNVTSCFIDYFLFDSSNNVCQKLFDRCTAVLYRFFGQIMFDRNCFIHSQLFYFVSSDI